VIGGLGDNTTVTISGTIAASESNANWGLAGFHPARVDDGFVPKYPDFGVSRNVVIDAQDIIRKVLIFECGNRANCGRKVFVAEFSDLAGILDEWLFP
jgi:hypothetical protein